MCRTILLTTLVLTVCLPSPAAAQDANPTRIAGDDDQLLAGTIPLPGYSVGGLFRLRGASEAPEVLRPHDPVGSYDGLPSAWFPVTGDGAFVGHDRGELWRLDPTGPERTIAVLDATSSYSVQPVGQARGVVFFAQATATQGSELWRTDGTAAGTWPVRDIEPGAGSSSPRGGVTVGSVVFFSAETSEHGRELWRTDGTADGTVRVTDVEPGPAWSSPELLGRLGGELVFSTIDDEFVSTLWITDGSRDGTRTLVSDAPRTYGGNRAVVVGDVLTFTAPNPSGLSSTVWRTDGTAEGTFELLSVALWTGPVAAAGKIWFGADRDEDTRGLWSSDGTRTGTRRVWALPDGELGSRIVDIVALGDGLAFRAQTAAEGASLWFTDGTSEGTIPVAGSSNGVYVDVGSPLPNTYYFGMLAATDDAAWFAASAGQGIDLWVTDGTVDGTRAVPLLGLTDPSEFPAPPPLLPFVDAGPVGPEPAPASDDPTVEPDPELLGIDRLRVKVRRNGAVDLDLRCRVSFAGDESLADEVLTIDIGGVPVAVRLNHRGRGRTEGGARVRARALRQRGDAPRELRIDVTVRRADADGALSDEGLTWPPTDPQEREIALAVVWRDTTHAASAGLSYRMRRGKGVAKLVD